MSGLFAVMLVVLGASAPLHPPDLQVEASTAAGTELPELAEAVARALVAGGARVVLRGPGSGPCENCTRVGITEAAPGSYRVDVTYRDRAASTVLRLPQGSLLFDRARAIAIQTRLLVTWDSGPETKVAAARPSRRTKAAVQADRPPESRSGTAAAVASPSAPRPYDFLPDLDQAPAAEAPSVPPVRTAQSEPQAPSPKAEAEAEKPVTAASADRGQDSRGRHEAAPAKSSRPLKTGATVDLSASGDELAPRRWPWIPTAIGAGAAIGAGICAVVARNRYNGLSDKGQSYDSARGLKSQGEAWQVAAFVLGGVAVAGLGTGIVGFSTGPSRGSSATALVSPVPGGGMVTLAGDLP
jgi:hypothetical protein